MWNTSTQAELHQIKVWPRASDVKYAKTRGTVLFDPAGGDLFAVLAIDQIHIYQRENYAIFHTIEIAKVNLIKLFKKL